MGYTHYYSSIRKPTADEWQQIRDDLFVLFKYAQHELGIPLADGSGEGGTQPKFAPTWIQFNGLGEDSHEDFDTNLKGDHAFCKTARKPYDVVVTAVLAYLSEVIGTHYVTSDGHGKDWLNGVELVRKALPQYGNTIDIPLGVRRADRWIGPYVYHFTARYQFRFCVDGKAYIFENDKEQDAYVFPDHVEAAKFFRRHKDVLDPYGSFNQKRITGLKRNQTALLKRLVEHRDLAERAGRPPLFVRPDDFPKLNAREEYRTLDSILALQEA